MMINRKPPENQEEFVELCDYIMEKHGTSHRELYEAMGITKVTYFRYRSGTREPTKPMRILLWHINQHIRTKARNNK